MELVLKYFRFHSSEYQRSLDFWQGVMKMPVERQFDAGARLHIAFQYPGDTVGLRFEMTRHVNLSLDDSKSKPMPTKPVGNVSLIVYVPSVSDVVLRAREFAFTPYLSPFEVNPLVQTAVLLDPNGLKVRLMQVSSQPLGTPKAPVFGRLGYLQIPIADYAKIEKNIQFYEETCCSQSLAARGLVMLGHSAAATRTSGGGGGGGAGGELGVGGALSKSTGGSSGSTLSAGYGKGGSDYGGSASSSSSGAQPGLVPRGSGAHFRVVDQDRFVEDLTTYVWLGNMSRQRTATLCLQHKSSRLAASASQSMRSTDINIMAPKPTGAAESSSGSGGGDESSMSLSTSSLSLSGDGSSASVSPLDADSSGETLFLGLSFLVFDLEAAIAHLKDSEVGNVNELGIRRVQGLPRFVSLIDPAAIFIEISDGIMANSTLDVRASTRQAGDELSTALESFAPP